MGAEKAWPKGEKFIKPFPITVKVLPKIDVETAIIWGSNDTVTPPEVADDFNKLLPKSELFWIKKCGHAPMMEHPVKFNSILKDWLKRKSL